MSTISSVLRDRSDVSRTARKRVERLLRHYGHP
ncbi:hypothetical protein AB0H18_26735 [Streptomyces sp. NPDC020766]